MGPDSPLYFGCCAGAGRDARLRAEGNTPRFVEAIDADENRRPRMVYARNPWLGLGSGYSRSLTAALNWKRIRTDAHEVHAESVALPSWLHSAPGRALVGGAS